MAFAGRLLGLAGLLPFLAATAGLWLRDDEALLRVAMLYGAVILSFLGGIQWGLALRGGTVGQLCWSVVPSLVGWGALLTGPQAAPLILGAGFVAAWAFEQGRTVREALPPWFRSLRVLLTAVVVACMIACALWVAGRW